MGDQLTEFLRRKEQAAGPPIDWQAKRDDWIRSVNGLYALVKSMLRESIESRAVTVRTFDVEATEDYIGTYTIQALELSVGGERVEFRPKGVLIIGGAGRVDINGGRDTVTLIKSTQAGDSEWTVILQRVPHLRTAPLDRESLKDALERVMLPLP
ncbi:MAG: hypothetical protein ABSF64_29815 [Bryobacteraceae bacterium]